MTDTTLPDDDPLGCGPDWRRAANSPLLQSADAVQAARATGRLAIATGRCRLFGVAAPIVAADIAMRAFDNLLLRVADLTTSANQLGDFFDSSDVPSGAEDSCLDLLHSRMDVWAGCIALIEALHDTQDAMGLDRLIDALADCDRAMQAQAELLAVAAETELLDTWRGCLANEFAQALPWWLDGTPERAALHAKETAERQIRAWQEWVRSAPRAERPMMSRPLWLPEFCPVMAATKTGEAAPVPTPDQALYWDEPGTDRFAEVVLPSRFAGPDHVVTMLFRHSDGPLATDLSGPVEVAGVAVTIGNGVARFTAKELQQAREALTLLVGSERIDWPRRVI
jgi:hypothetical protein